MSNIDINFPRPTRWHSATTIAAPEYSSFERAFAYPASVPKPIFLSTALGRTAVYDIPPIQNHHGTQELRILMVHGVQTPALGLLPLARAVQKLRPNAHIAIFDLFGHGLSDTPILPHTTHIFHLQIMHVLAYLHWTTAHIVGFSFGGATTLSFLRSSPASFQSVILLASAGMVEADESLRRLLDDDSKEEEARAALMTWLEGGELTVPSDWQSRSRDGDIVGEALRDWELKNHQGHAHSVLSIFRDGGVCGRYEDFQHLANSDIRHLVVIAEQDDVCPPEKLAELGFSDVKVVKSAGHGFVRTHAAEAAALIDAWFTSWY